jgi:asparagine synthase (glutamine-hydrolysing)
MSGIFGCWHLDGLPVNGATFEKSLERISPQGARGSEAWVDGSIGLGRKPSHGSVPATQSMRCAHVTGAFDGRIDNRDELLETLSNRWSLDSDSADVRLVLAAYLEYGESCVERISGDFALGLFDRQLNRLLLARDRLGIRPLCYTRVKGAFLFASEAKALLAWPGVHARPDDVMLADFVLQFLSSDSQRRTFFRNIHSLPPAHLLIVTHTGSELRRYFEFDTRRQIRFRTVREYAGAFHELFVASVRHRLRSAQPVGVSVSGGLDSAYIFCVAQDLARREPALCPGVLGFNYDGLPGTPSDEREYVDAIERSSGASIERIAQRPGFMECASKEVWHSESPLVEGLARQRQAMLDRVTASGATRLLTGHWGDQVLSDSDYLIDLCRSRRWTLLKRHAHEWGVSGRRLATRFMEDVASRRLPAPILRTARRLRRRGDGVWHSPWFTDRFRVLLRERFEDGRLKAAHGTSHARAIYQQSRRGYHVQCMEWNARVAAMRGIDMAFPYLDCDLLQFLMAIPGDVQSHDGVPRGLMREAMVGIVPDAVVRRRSKGEFTHLANQSIEYDFALISDILGPTALSVRLGYVNGPVLWRMLDEWRATIRGSSNTSLTNRVIDLCGMELLLRRFTWDGEERT